MKTGQIWTIVIVSLVVAVIVSIATVSITGNVIKQNNQLWGKYEVYTKPEIDGLVTLIKKDIAAAGNAAPGVLSRCEGVLASEFNFDPAYPEKYTCSNVCSKKGKTCAAGVGLYDKSDYSKGISFYSCNQASSVIHVDLTCLCC